ncbi:MAG: DUF5668 domain-containing protein [Flavipsychrobacter sp.]
MSNQISNRRKGRSSKEGDKRWFGFAVLLVGAVILLRKLELLNFNIREFWPIILIAVGLLIGIKNKFRNNAPYILIAIGVFKLIPEFTILGVSSATLALPAGLMLIGIYIIFKPQSKKKGGCYKDIEANTNDSDLVNVDVTFGGRKEIVTSKTFKGGDVNITFGGAEINLLQADNIDGAPMVLNTKVAFGGVELIIPSDWDVKNNIDPSFGSLEDHRSMYTGSASTEDKKTLVLNGSCTFGSIEIKSY